MFKRQKTKYFITRYAKTIMTYIESQNVYWLITVIMLLQIKTYLRIAHINQNNKIFMYREKNQN